jgi:hypothetical protein
VRAESVIPLPQILPTPQTLVARFVADRYKPKRDGPRVVLCSGVECANPDFVPIIEHTKVFSLEISDWQAALRILADDID